MIKWPSLLGKKSLGITSVIVALCLLSSCAQGTPLLVSTPRPPGELIAEISPAAQAETAIPNTVPALSRIIAGVDEPVLLAREIRARVKLTEKCMRQRGFALLDEDTIDTNPTWLAMDPQAKDAYKVALYGTASPEDVASSAGCSSLAYARIPGSGNVGASLSNAWLDSLERFRESPAIKAAMKDWSLCMAAGGFDFETDAEIPRAADSSRIRGVSLAADVGAASAYNERNCAEQLRKSRRVVAASVEAEFRRDHRVEIDAIVARNDAMKRIVDANQ